MNKKLLKSLSGALFAATLLFCAPGHADDNSRELLGETNPLAALSGNRFDGTWWLSYSVQPQRGLILTLNRVGTFTLEDSIGGGGYTPSSFSLIQGIWQRSGPRAAKALGLRFVYNGDGTTKSVERVRLEFQFEGGFQQIAGELQFEEMLCEDMPSPLPFDVPVCPDPTTAPTGVLRGPGPFTAVRLDLDDPN